MRLWQWVQRAPDLLRRRIDPPKDQFYMDKAMRPAPDYREWRKYHDDAERQRYETK